MQVPTVKTLLAVVGLLAGGLLAAAAGHAQPDRPRAVEVAPRAWMVEGVCAKGSSANRNVVSNAAFVVTDDRVVVLDALGSPALAEELIAEIRRLTPLPIRHRIVSHDHADPIDGLQAFKAAGAEILAHELARGYLASDTARLRMEASREALFPWIDEATRLVAADRWLRGDLTLTLGGTEFRIVHAGPAHTPEDLVVCLPGPRVLLAGDLVFRARIPFVGEADRGAWVRALDRLLEFDTAVIVPGHGPVSSQARDDLRLTRECLVFLREAMARAAQEFEPFEEAHAATDGSRSEHLPLFRAANRINACNTYLLMERNTT